MSRMVSAAAPLVLAGVLACDTTGEMPLVQVGPPYDTVAVAGDAAETDSLLVFRSPGQLQFLGERVVVFADNTGGRLTAVDLESREGWQVNDRGAEGPGLFGGNIPWIFESGESLYTVTMDGQRATRTADGALVDAQRFRHFISDSTSYYWPVLPMGMTGDGRLVAYFRQRWDSQLGQAQELNQGVRAYGLQGVSWTFDDLPQYVTKVVRGPGTSVRDSAIAGEGVMVDARHTTVVIAQNHQPWILTLNAMDGSRRAERVLPYDVFQVFVDRDERIWVQVWGRNDRETGSYLVLNQDLEVIDVVGERSVRDASGDLIVSVDRDEYDVRRIHLLKKPN